MLYKYKVSNLGLLQILKIVSTNLQISYTHNLLNLICQRFSCAGSGLRGKNWMHDVEI